MVSLVDMYLLLFTTLSIFTILQVIGLGGGGVGCDMFVVIFFFNFFSSGGSIPEAQKLQTPELWSWILI